MARLKAAGLAFCSLLFLTQSSCAHARKIKRQSSENNLISSGTCYYGAGQVADSVYIPCGNTAFGNFHCCEAQSNCLDNNACYDGSQGTTYVAGCTDPNYLDSSCPTKGPYSNQQWSGLVYCNGTSNEWTLCDDSSAGSTQVVAVPGCYCPTDETRNVAFDAPSVLGSQVVLPAATGESMSLFPGFTLGTVLTSTYSSTTTTTTTTTQTPPPTTSKTTSKTPNAIVSTSSAYISTTSSYSISTSSPTSATSSSQYSSSDSSSSSGTSSAAAASSSAALVAPHTSGLSTGAKAGIGAGAGIGLVALLAFLAVCLRRRKRRSMLSDAPTYPSTEVQPMTYQQPRQQYQAHPGPNPNRYSPAWSAGAHSELVGDTSTSSPSIPQSNWSRPLSEAEGTYPTYQSMASSELAAGGVGAYQQSQPYQAATTSSTSQGSYQPGRRVEGGERGFYEMPAHLPGSTMM